MGVVCSGAVRAAVLALLLVACDDPADRIRGEWTVDVDRLTQNERLAPLGRGPARTLAVDLARAHYAATSFTFEPPRCTERQRGSEGVFPCEVVRVDSGRVVVVDVRHPEVTERLRLHVAKDAAVTLERGEQRLPLKRGSLPR